MEKLNIAELLKNCPKGMELDCTICNGVKFIELDKNPNYPIVVRANNGYEFSLTKYGQVHNIDDAKCVIYPKGKTTWEGFVPPYSFNDGDIVATTNGLFVGIIEVKNNKPVGAYCSVDYVKDFRINSDYVFDRLATTWEKEKLFQAIKDNGYKWNEETKTLEKFTPDKFDITALKPFESKVLVRHNKDNKWCGSFFSHIDGNLHSHCYKYVTIAGKSYPMCIPYEGNEHLLGTTNDCDNFYKTWE